MFHLDHLPNQRPGEQTMLFLRRHWIDLFKLTAITAFACLAPLALLWLISQTAPDIASQEAGAALASVFLSVFYLAVITFFFQEFVDYYLDTWIVTSERVINIEQNGLFNRTASELHLVAIQDVSAELKGIVATFLDYGDVKVQTAGALTHFHFKSIPHPERVREVILRLVNEDKQRHSVAERI